LAISVALCSLTTSLNPEIDTSSVDTELITIGGLLPIHKYQTKT
jgi:hypothetical protein